MNMVLFISNLMIISMTVIVIFCIGPSNAKETSLGCIKQLEAADYKKRNTGFQNLNIKLLNLDPFPRYNNCRSGIEIYKKKIIKQIDKVFINQDNKYEVLYFNHLSKYILDPERMLPITTWCAIYEKEAFNVNVFLKSDSLYLKYLKHIAHTTGFSKNKQTLVFHSMHVCYSEIINYAKEKENVLDLNALNLRYYLRKYKDTEKSLNSPHPLNWCAINVCYESLLDAGFMDVSAKQNIKDGVLSNLEIKETSGYAFDFYEYLKNLSIKSEGNSEKVSLHESSIDIKFGNLRNWCGVKVCHDDLINAGYKFKHASDHFMHILPTIKETMGFMPEQKFKNYIMNKDIRFQNDIKIISNYVIEYSTHLELTADGIGQLSHIPKYKKLANRILRNPLDWCKYTVITLNL